MLKMNSYVDFVDFCEKTHYQAQNQTYILTIKNNSLIIMDKSTVTLVEYSFENVAIKDLFMKILSIKENDNKKIFVNKSNNYQFIMNYGVMGVLLASEYLKSKNVDTIKHFKIQSKSGKVRDIYAPAEEVKVYLKKLNKMFQSTYDSRNSDFQVAYKKGKSIKTNANPHKDNNYVFKIDLHHFFPSCKRELVEKYIDFIFNNTINRDMAKNMFLDNILMDDALYIGNPISGTIANAIISKPVSYMKNICDKYDMQFSVYADDMTFSSKKFLDKDFVISIFNQAFTVYNLENYFTLSEDKCYGVSAANRSVTGVVINHKNQVTCHRHIYSDIRQTLYELNRGNASHYNYNKLHGQISFMMMLDESGKLANLVNKYRSIIEKYNLLSKEKIELVCGGGNI